MGIPFIAFFFAGISNSSQKQQENNKQSNSHAAFNIPYIFLHIYLAIQGKDKALMYCHNPKSFYIKDTDNHQQVIVRTEA